MELRQRLSSVIPPDGKLLILINGAYGHRMLKIAGIHRIHCESLIFTENTQPDVSALESALKNDPAISHVAVVHCETTTGIINPIDVYGEIVKEYHRTYIVDAMSSFGAYPVDLKACGIDYLISSSNKCIEGVPGFSFVLARTESLMASAWICTHVKSRPVRTVGRIGRRWTIPLHASDSCHSRFSTSIA